MAAYGNPRTWYEWEYFRIKSDTIENVMNPGGLGDHKAGIWCNLGAVKILSSSFFNYFQGLSPVLATVLT